MDLSIKQVKVAAPQLGTSISSGVLPWDHLTGIAKLETLPEMVNVYKTMERSTML
jgi:hypothetical protein